MAMKKAAQKGQDADAKLPEGLYPFIDERLPLSELVMTEAKQPWISTAA
jgi:hypothetical protein